MPIFAQKPLILEIQRDIVNDHCDVVQVLRKSLVAARKLELQELSSWIDNELRGYPDVPASDLPAYRHVHVTPRFLNPYHGWMPIVITDDFLREKFSNLPISQPIGELKQSADESVGNLTMSYPNFMEEIIRKEMHVPVDIRGHVSKAAVYGIIDSVKNAVLEWTLKLEAAGIVGDGMSFSAAEKAEAAPVTQNFYAQNIGHVGDVSQGGIVANKQKAIAHLDLGRVAEVVGQIEGAIDVVPEEIKPAVHNHLATIRSELSSKSPSKSKIREALLSLRAVAENAAGNLGAAGILALVGALLSGS